MEIDDVLSHDGGSERTNERTWQAREGGKERIEGRTDGWPGNPDRVSRADPTETGRQYGVGRRARFRLSGRSIVQACFNVGRSFFRSRSFFDLKEVARRFWSRCEPGIDVIVTP